MVNFNPVDEGYDRRVKSDIINTKERVHSVI